MVLSEVIQAFSVPENAARMEEARESACNDMGKMLQLVLPVATQIQQEVIKAYGFNNEGEGENEAALWSSIDLPQDRPEALWLDVDVSYRKGLLSAFVHTDVCNIQ